MKQNVKAPKHYRLADRADIFMGSKLYIERKDGTYSLHVCTKFDTRSSFDQYLKEGRLFVEIDPPVIIGEERVISVYEQLRLFRDII